jgi:hypothetical protein
VEIIAVIAAGGDRTRKGRKPAWYEEQWPNGEYGVINGRLKRRNTSNRKLKKHT